MDAEKIDINNSEDIKQYLALILGKLEFIDERIEQMAKITKEEIQRLLSLAKAQDEKLKQFSSLDVNDAAEVQRLKDEIATLQSESEFLNDENLNSEIESFINSAEQNVSAAPVDGGPAPATIDTSDATTPVVDQKTGTLIDPAQVNSPLTNNADVTIDNAAPNNAEPVSGNALPDGSTIDENGTRTFKDGSKIDKNGVRTPPAGGAGASAGGNAGGSGSGR